MGEVSRAMPMNTMGAGGAALACCICTGMIIGCCFPFIMWNSEDTAVGRMDIGIGLWGTYLYYNDNGEYNTFDCDGTVTFSNGNGPSFNAGAIGGSSECSAMRGLYVTSLILSMLAFCATVAGALGPPVALAAAAGLHFLGGFFMMVTASYMTDKMDGSPDDYNFSYVAPWLFWLL